MNYVVFTFLCLAGCQTTQLSPPDIRCAGTKMIGWENKTELSKQDLWSYEEAKNTCPMKYNGKNPCLVTFYKVVEGTYRATCGAPKK